MERIVPYQTMILDVSSTGDACPGATDGGFSPAKPCHECGDHQKANKALAEEYEDEVDSWLSLDPDSDSEQNNNGYSCGEVDCHLERKGLNSCFENQYQVCCDPQQCHGIYQGNIASEGLEIASEQQYWKDINLGMEYETARARFVHSPFGSQSVSAPYITPEATMSNKSNSYTRNSEWQLPEATMSYISNSYGRASKWQLGKHSSTTPQMPPNFTTTDREAKVQRYREKRGKRNFEKTIRYASRQAYAETRPRVRGKFAREAEKEENEIDQMFSMDKYPREIGPSF